MSSKNIQRSQTQTTQFSVIKKTSQNFNGSKILNISSNCNKSVKEAFRQTLRPEKKNYVVDPRTVKLNKIPDEIKRKLNVKISAKPPNIEDINQMCSHRFTNKESVIKETLNKFSNDKDNKNFHKRTYSGNLTRSFDISSNVNLFYSSVKQLDKNKDEVNHEKKTIKDHSPFSLYKYTKCHKYHTHINNHLVAEDQLNKDQNFILSDTGHSNNLDSLNKNLTPLMLPLSIPIFSTKLKSSHSVKSIHNDSSYITRPQSPNLLSSCGFGNELIRKLKESSDRMSPFKQLKTQMKNSDILISDLLDSKYANSGNSKKRLIQNEIENSQKNFFKRKTSEADFTLNNSLIYNNQALDKYIEALESFILSLDHSFEKQTLQTKVSKLLDSTNNRKKEIRLGALVTLYLIIKRYKLDDDSIELILPKMIDFLHNYDNQEEMFLVACMEILYLFSDHNIVRNEMCWISTFITDFSYIQLKKTAFNLLMASGYEGIKVIQKN